MSENRPSTCGRIASRSNAPARIRTEPALLGRDAEVIGPERHQPLDEAGLAQRRALEPGQRLGAVGLHDHIDRLRRFARGRFRRPHHVRLLRLDLAARRRRPPTRRTFSHLDLRFRRRGRLCGRLHAASAPRRLKAKNALPSSGDGRSDGCSSKAAFGRASSALTKPRGSEAALAKSPDAPPRAPKPKRFRATSAPCGSRANCVSCFRRIRPA